MSHQKCVDIIMTENFVYKNDNLVPSFTEHVESVES